MRVAFDSSSELLFNCLDEIDRLRKAYDGLCYLFENGDGHK